MTLNKLFTIGQFAKMHQINKKTLMYYDEINLLKPEIIKDNGYRYYSYRQSSILETILMLKELNMSLEDIKAFINDKSIDHLDAILDGKLFELTETISHLKGVQKLLEKKQTSLKLLKYIDFSQISIVEKEQEYLVTVPLDRDNLANTFSNIISETLKYQVHRLHDAEYGSMIKISDIINKNFDNYELLYINLSQPLTHEGLHVVPKGKYLQAFYKGPWDNIYTKYLEIMEYAKKNNLELTGYAYEKGINELVIDTFDEYITKIEIQIK